MTILPSLEMISGRVWGDSLTYTFFTDSLRVLNFTSRSNTYWDTTVSPSASVEFFLYLNAEVDPDSFSLAASFAPPIRGFWYGYRDYRYQQTYLGFFLTDTVGLRSEREYALNIDGSVELVDGMGFGDDLTLTFRTDPVLIERIRPEPDYPYVHPGTGVDVYFNTEMDSVSTQAAFELVTADRVPVPGTFAWSEPTRMQFRPDSLLQIGHVYIVRIDTTAMNMWGDHLKEEGLGFFRVQY